MVHKTCLDEIDPGHGMTKSLLGQCSVFSVDWPYGALLRPLGRGEMALTHGWLKETHERLPPVTVRNSFVSVVSTVMIAKRILKI